MRLQGPERSLSNERRRLKTPSFHVTRHARCYWPVANSGTPPWSRLPWTPSQSERIPAPHPAAASGVPGRLPAGGATSNLETRKVLTNAAGGGRRAEGEAQLGGGVFFPAPEAGRASPPPTRPQTAHWGSWCLSFMRSPSQKAKLQKPLTQTATRDFKRNYFRGQNSSFK